MEETCAYTRSDWIRAVNLSGFLGWAVFALPIMFVLGVGGSWADFWGVLLFTAIIGLPIAFTASWLIAAPILKRLMRHNLTWIGTVLWGGAISFLIALVGTVLGRINGWRISMDPSFDFQLGGGDYIREIDGILTSYGWLLHLQSVAEFVAIGILIALVVRAIIGKGRNITDTNI